MRAVRRIGSLLLWWTVPALAATLVAAYVGLAVVRGVNPPVVPVEGISMHPLLHAGDLVLLKKVAPSHLRKGDIIAFHTTGDVQKKYQVPGSYVHRIVTVEKGAYGYQFQTKGDNNAGKDPFWTVQSSVIGEYAGKIPAAGYPILFFRSTQGKILIASALGILALYALLGVLERRSDARELNMLTLAGIVEEARGLKDAMEQAAGAAVRTPPAAPPSHDSATVRELVGAIGEYGEHLRSHTAVMRGLAATTENLQQATRDLGTAVGGPPARSPAPFHPLLDLPVLARAELADAAPATEHVDALLDRMARSTAEHSRRREELRASLGARAG